MNTSMNEQAVVAIEIIEGFETPGSTIKPSVSDTDKNRAATVACYYAGLVARKAARLERRANAHMLAADFLKHVAMDETCVHAIGKWAKANPARANSVVVEGLRTMLICVQFKAYTQAAFELTELGGLKPSDIIYQANARTKSVYESMALA